MTCIDPLQMPKTLNGAQEIYRCIGCMVDISRITESECDAIKHEYSIFINNDVVNGVNVFSGFDLTDQDAPIP